MKAYILSLHTHSTAVVGRDANNFCRMIMIFKADFSIMILTSKFWERFENGTRLWDKIKGYTAEVFRAAMIHEEEDIMVLNNVTKFHKILIKIIWVWERTSFKMVNFHKQRAIYWLRLQFLLRLLQTKWLKDLCFLISWLTETES